MRIIASYTVAQGQRVAVWDNSGRRTIIEGPRRVRLWGRRIEPLETFVAGPTQYLIIHWRDGRVTHERGPVVFWMDPVEHAKVSVADAITLDANEALVVYFQNEGRVDRRVVRGPELFVPKAQEWLHDFSWHGSDPRDPRKKIPRALVFTKLRIIPDQMYFDVDSVRTADDALIIVKLMIFYELIDIGVMLDQTHDPIADFINAVSADVIEFASGLNFEAFKEQTDRLNARETYEQLSQRAGRIGYRINKVVYRGYQATDKLQSMHDNAIEIRTRMKLDAENEVQAQGLADLKLNRERERSLKRQEMERIDLEHQGTVKRIAHEETLRQRQVEHEARIRQSRDDQEAQLRNRQARLEQIVHSAKAKSEVVVQTKQALYEQRGKFLKTVQELKVDLTRYLVARHERPDRRIQVDGDTKTQLHLHE